MGINDKFMKAYNAYKNGEISEDELLASVKKVVAQMNPKFSDSQSEEMAKILIKSQSATGFAGKSGGKRGSSKKAEKNNKPKEDNTELSTEAKLEKLMARVDELIEPVDTVRLHPKRGETTVFYSKMGGVPYFPKSMKYPVVLKGEHKGKPLCFLAQLNLGTLPKIPGFPTEGILQFFTGCDGDELCGMNYDNQFDQNRFRVIYHEKVVTDASELYSEQDMPDFGEREYFPFKGEFLLTAEKAEPMRISAYDFRFDKVVAAAYNEIFGGKVEFVEDWSKTGKGINDFDAELADAINTCDCEETRMGGYPYFTQDDPRGDKKKYAKCTVLLFQSASENGGEEDNRDDQINWGDMGVATFFIDPKDLEKRDFSKVMFYWDCG